MPIYNTTTFTTGLCNNSTSYAYGYGLETTNPAEYSVPEGRRQDFEIVRGRIYMFLPETTAHTNGCWQSGVKLRVVGIEGDYVYVEVVGNDVIKCDHGTNYHYWKLGGFRKHCVPLARLENED